MDDFNLSQIDGRTLQPKPQRRLIVIELIWR
jgi:hypothetical protein